MTQPEPYNVQTDYAARRGKDWGQEIYQDGILTSFPQACGGFSALMNRNGVRHRLLTNRLDLHDSVQHFIGC